MDAGEQQSGPGGGERRFDLAVAGAGIMGLACAWELARRGWRVAVFDPFAGGTKASWAAAGILVTRAAQAFTSPYREFYVRSIEAFPDWLAAVREAAGAAGAEIALSRTGDHLIYALDDKRGRDGLEAKLGQLRRERARGYTVTDTLPEFLRPFAGTYPVRSLHFPEEACVRNRDLLAALRKACEKAGVTIFPETALRNWSHGAGRSTLSFADFSLDCGQILIAAGAWSGEALRALGLELRMIPVKGQMLRIPKFHAGEAMVHFGEDVYLVPRGDSLMLGATTEPGVWDESGDAEGRGYLEAQLRRYLPGAADAVAHPVESWAGIRPRTHDRLPLMGWLDAEKGLAICTGHYKSGISMAPLAARSLSRLLSGEKPPLDLSPFDPWRKGAGITRI